jgi:hypothetical protein
MEKHIERTFQLLRSQENSWRASSQPQPETESP